MGKVYSHVAWRISRNMNPEWRAQKLIAQDKIRPAPRHKATEDYLQTLRREQPQLSEKIEKKDTELLKRLENVYVTSNDTTVVDPTAPDRRAGLPTDRTPYEPTKFGYSEPDRVRYGHVTLRTALGFLAQHAENPTVHTADSIAHKYNLDGQATEDVLKYFKMMGMHTSDSMGQIAQLEWTSEDPISELPFKDSKGNIKFDDLPDLSVPSPRVRS